MEFTTSPRDLGTGEHEIQAPVRSSAARRDACSAGRPLYDLEEGLQQTIDWYRDLPRGARA